MTVLKEKQITEASEQRIPNAGILSTIIFRNDFFASVVDNFPLPTISMVGNLSTHFEDFIPGGVSNIEH